MVDGAIFLSSKLSSSGITLLFYTDPGTGSLVWQLLLASFIGGVFYVRLMARRVKERLGASRRNESPGELDPTDSKSAN